ncbi:MAG TPA: hypothetical protein VL173_17730 [Vicinamibacterales bacterium]|nr:hypothetical protein [Vicinamibacterales bacterium]
MEVLEVTTNESALLLDRPSLELPFSHQRRLEVGEFLRMNEDDRTSAGSVRAAFARLVVSNTTREIRCHSNVKRVVSAEKQVDPRHSDDDAIVGKEWQQR